MKNAFAEKLAELITQEFEKEAEFCATSTGDNEWALISDDGEGNLMEVKIKLRPDLKTWVEV